MFSDPSGLPLTCFVPIFLTADSPKKKYSEPAPASSLPVFHDLKKIDRTLAADDSEAELRQGLRMALNGDKPSLPSGADALEEYRPGYGRGRMDEDVDMMDADPMYDEYNDGQGGIEWAEQEYDERYPDGYPDDYYGDYEGEELGACGAGRPWCVTLLV